MPTEVQEIRTEEDAQSLSEMILRSLEDAVESFNPFQGRIFKYNDGSITFMGCELRAEEAPHYIAKHVWRNRKKINKQIKKRQKIGPDFVNCGC
jgi:hypothetical protein